MVSWMVFTGFGIAMFIAGHWLGFINGIGYRQSGDD